MKKVLCTSLAMLLIFSGITVAYASEANTDSLTAANKAIVAVAGTTTTTTTSTGIETTPEAVTIVPDMTFTGTTVSLSLDAAYKKMLSDSSGAEMAELNKISANGIAHGYGESVHLISQAENKSAELAKEGKSELAPDYSTTDKNILKINQAFAAAQGPRNYTAEMNTLKSTTLENYYTLKELENQVQISKNNLALKEKLLSNTQLKYRLGTVSKSNLLQAETAVNEAKDLLIAAQNGLDSMKMGFNQFMGYSLMQNVTLTDSIKEIPLSSKSLTASIKDALANRSEIFEAAYNVEVSTLNLANYKGYPSSSSKYVKAKMSLLMAETAKENAPLTVESDVRTKYMAMNAKYSAVQTGKKSVENAGETARLTQLQYDAGLATLSDVDGAQLAYYTEQLDYSKALLEYNLAVNAYELSSTVGVEAVAIN